MRQAKENPANFPNQAAISRAQIRECKRSAKQELKNEALRLFFEGGKSIKYIVGHLEVNECTCRGWVQDAIKTRGLKPEQQSYTKEQKEKALSLHFEGKMKKEDIANQLNIKLTTLCIIISLERKKLGLPPLHSRYTEEERTEAIHLYFEEKKKKAEISVHLGINKLIIDSWIFSERKNRNSPPMHNVYSEDTKQEALRLFFTEGKKEEEISYLLGVKYPTLYFWIKNVKDQKIAINNFLENNNIGAENTKQETETIIGLANVTNNANLLQLPISDNMQDFQVDRFIEEMNTCTTFEPNKQILTSQETSPTQEGQDRPYLSNVWYNAQQYSEEVLAEAPLIQYFIPEKNLIEVTENPVFTEEEFQQNLEEDILNKQALFNIQQSNEMKQVILPASREEFDFTLDINQEYFPKITEVELILSEIENNSNNSENSPYQKKGETPPFYSNHSLAL